MIEAEGFVFIPNIVPSLSISCGSYCFKTNNELGGIFFGNIFVSVRYTHRVSCDALTTLANQGRDVGIEAHFPDFQFLARLK